MNNKKAFYKFIFCSTFIFFFSIPTIIFGQSVKRECISSYGSSSLMGSIYISQTAGQTFSTNAETQNNSGVNQGFQQSNRFVLVKLSLEESDFLEMNIFPNPAQYSVNLTSNELIKNCNLIVYDGNGKIIIKKEINNLTNYTLNCEKWVNGTYFLKIYDNNQKQQTLKLVILK